MIATLLVGLYPPAIRERWGPDLSHDVSASGIGSWPDTLSGAARTWLHPSDWPETVTGQTRRVVTMTLFAITAAAGLVLRTVAPSAILTADIRHPATSLWLAPLVLGIILAAPLPQLRYAALRQLTFVAVRTMAAPAVAVLGLLLMAWSSLGEHATGVADDAMTLYYWLTLTLVALRLCTLVARIANVAALPSTLRLSSALLLMGTGLGLAAIQSFLAMAREQ